MEIALIGSGNVGSALGEAWVRAGHRLVIGSRQGPAGESPVAGARCDTVSSAVRGAGAVVLAVPWAAVPEVMQQGGDWRGKIVIDCTNPIGPGFQLAVGLNSSGAEQVAALAPGARVAKAFNTVGFNVMRNPVFHGKAATMLFCSDDEDAKQAAKQLIADAGFEPVFAGPLRQARYLEPLAMLWITMAQSGGREFAFTIVSR